MPDKPKTAYDYMSLVCAASELRCAVEDRWPETVKFGEFKKSEAIRILDNVYEFFDSLADAAANREIIKYGGKIGNSIPSRFAKMQRKFDPDGRIIATYMENPLLKLLLDTAAEKTGKSLFIKPLLKTIKGGKNAEAPLLKTIKGGKNAEARTWRLDVYEDKGARVFEIAFARFDEMFGHLAPKMRETMVDLRDRCRSLQEAMIAASITMRESRALVARSRGKPYLAAAFGKRTIRGE
jgi:hypothetical protein